VSIVPTSGCMVRHMMSERMFFRFFCLERLVVLLYYSLSLFSLTTPSRYFPVLAAAAAAAGAAAGLYTIYNFKN